MYAQVVSPRSVATRPFPIVLTFLFFSTVAPPVRPSCIVGAVTVPMKTNLIPTLKMILAPLVPCREPRTRSPTRHQLHPPAQLRTLVSSGIKTESVTVGGLLRVDLMRCSTRSSAVESYPRPRNRYPFWIAVLSPVSSALPPLP